MPAFTWKVFTGSGFGSWRNLVTSIVNRRRSTRDACPGMQSALDGGLVTTDQAGISETPYLLNFADLFVDGCDTRFVMGAEGKVRVALPEGCFVQLDAVYRGKLQPSEFRCEYDVADVPAPWNPKPTSA